MKEAIRRRAIELGFDDCRFTTADPPASAGQFQKWIADRHHGEMSWIERNAGKRADPQKVLAGAKSIICLAASYAIDVQRHAPGDKDPPVTGPPHSSPVTRHGIIARYARFADYHTVLDGPLKALAASVNQLGGNDTRSLWYTDTGPLLERDLAQRASIGFVGKHTNLISRTLGNWIFLSEILTTLELEPDPPEKNHCGNCTRCITACPTHAITAPFTLDARKCISYLTIELKGSIPVELRPAIGNRIYGCDDCLATCPWNRFARAGHLMQPYFKPALQAPDLMELLSLDQPQFKTRFSQSPILRAKRRGLLRNVCVALGNAGDATALPALAKAAGDPEPLIAEHARWAIDQINTKTRASG